MFYNQFGKPIEEQIGKQTYGQSVFATPADRETSDVSRGLTPELVDSILTSANGGDTQSQCRLAVELEEKNWDIAQALETRRNAVMGVPWTVDSPQAKKAAEAAKIALDAASCATNAAGLDGFKDLTHTILTSILPGFAVSEIIWKPGGEIAAFQDIPQRHFTFVGGMTPRLVTLDHPNGLELPPNKFVFVRNSHRRSEVWRGGLIRPLAWLHCFQILNVKDLLSFIERYGMPFVVAKVDQASWDNEKTKLQNLIRNFGPSGGGLFTRNTEIELLQAANNTGDVYFKLLGYVEAAIQKLILGQTASSGDSSGLSKGDSQSKVRQDILEADCSLVSDVCTIQVLRPWNNFNNAQGTPCPKVVLHCEPPENLKATADTVDVLYNAGLETDPKEMSEKFGMTLTRKVVVPAAVPQATDALPLSANSSDKSDPSDLSDEPALESWAKPAISKILDALENPDTAGQQAGDDIAKLADIGFEDFDGEALDNFLGVAAIDSLAQGKIDEAKKVKQKTGTR